MPFDFKTGFLLKLSKNFLRESWYELSLFGYTAWGTKDGHFSFFQSLCQIGLTLFPRARILFTNLLIYHVTKPVGNKV